jgi:hypothetical protein
MYLLSKEQIVPVFVFESQSAKLYNQLYAEHLQNQANINEQILSEQKSISARTLMPEDIHDLKEYHSSNRSSPDSPQNMTHYPDSHMSHDPRDMPHTHTTTYESQMTHNDGRDSPINKMGEVIHITDSYEDEDIDVGDHVSVGDSNQLAKQNHLTSDLPIGSLVSPARHESQPQRQSVIVSLEDYARNQTFTPMSHDVTMSHGHDVDTRVKIEPEYPVAPAKTVDLYPIKMEPNHDQLDDRHYEPKIDQSLSPYTPANSLRPIEEHNQYRGNDPDQRDRQFRCGFCHKVFRRKEEKKRHENSHLNIRSHKCKVCSKTFMRADHRNSHEKTHNKEKEFNCKICNKSFRRADEHKRHMTRQIHLRNVQRAKAAAAAAKAGGQSSHSGMMHL